MKRRSLVKIHIISSLIGSLTLLGFFTSTIISEMLQEYSIIKSVKEYIFRLLPLIIISMPSIAISGIKLTGNSKSPVILKKLNRMRIIAFNGILLILLAIFLYTKSVKDEFDILFWFAQTLELILGGINLTLITLNIKSGITLSGRFGKRTTTKKSSIK